LWVIYRHQSNILSLSFFSGKYTLIFWMIRLVSLTKFEVWC
jgi:hypothetical protein